MANFILSLGQLARSHGLSLKLGLKLGFPKELKIFYLRSDPRREEWRTRGMR